jgi:uncharacterized protein YggU (UPF0235/DUF167 family)
MPSSRIDIRVQPKARKEGVSLAPDGVLQVSVAAVPEDGKANDAVFSLLAKTLRIPKRAIVTVAGHRGRRKIVQLLLDAEELRERLASNEG